MHAVKPRGTAEANASSNIGKMAIKLTVSSRNDVGHSSWSVILYWLQRDRDFDYAASNSSNVFDLAFSVSVRRYDLSDIGGRKRVLITRWSRRKNVTL